MRQLAGLLLVLSGVALVAMSFQIGYFIQECFSGECGSSDRLAFGLVVLAGPAMILAGVLVLRLKRQ